MQIFPKIKKQVDRTGETVYILKVNDIKEKTTTTTNRKFELIKFCGMKVKGNKEEELPFEGIRLIWGPREISIEHFDEDDLPVEEAVQIDGDKNFHAFKIGDLFEGRIYQVEAISKSDECDVRTFNCVVFNNEEPLLSIAKQLYYFPGYRPFDKNGEIFIWEPSK